jgi:hypothetical protein
LPNLVDLEAARSQGGNAGPPSAGDGSGISPRLARCRIRQLSAEDQLRSGQSGSRVYSQGPP